jgi:phasin family protein
LAQVRSPKKSAVKTAKPAAKRVVAAPAKPVAKVAAAPVKPVVAPVAVAPVAAPVVAASVPPVVSAPEPAPVVAKQVEVKPAVAEPAPAPIKDIKMNDTMEKVQETIKANTEEATAKATAFFTDANVRAKDAMAKGSKAVEEMVEFSKGNLEAMMTSGRVAAKGAEDIAKYSAEYGRATIEKANATAKRFAEVKSPTEFFQLQSEIAKSTLDAVVAEGSKFTESYLKLLGEVTQPIQNRVAVAVEKVKTSVAA